MSLLSPFLSVPLQIPMLYDFAKVKGLIPSVDTANYQNSIRAAGASAGKSVAEYFNMSSLHSAFVESRRILTYPTELRESCNKTSAAGAGRPVVILTCHDTRNGYENAVSIVLPVPIGLQVADSSSWAGIDLGFIASNVTDSVSSGSVNAMMSKLRQVGSDFLRGATGDPRTALEFASGKLGGGGLVGAAAKGVGFSAGLSANKNTVLEFTGSGIRGFSFSYKATPRTREEAQTLKEINNIFRRSMYATTITAGAYLEYPPSWTIRFVDLGTGQDLEYLPRVWECKLASLSSTFNGSTNMWREDNSPVEFDFSVTFSENKVLNQSEILRLEAGPIFTPGSVSAKSAVAIPVTQNSSTQPGGTVTSPAPSSTPELPLFQEQEILTDPNDGFGVLPPKPNA